jgi:hypothetical protein
MWNITCFITGYNCNGSKNFGLGSLRDGYVGLPQPHISIPYLHIGLIAAMYMLVLKSHN